VVFDGPCANAAVNRVPFATHRPGKERLDAKDEAEAWPSAFWVDKKRHDV